MRELIQKKKMRERDAIPCETQKNGTKGMREGNLSHGRFKVNHHFIHQVQALDNQLPHLSPTCTLQ